MTGKLRRLRQSFCFPFLVVYSHHKHPKHHQLEDNLIMDIPSIGPASGGFSYILYYYFCRY